MASLFLGKVGNANNVFEIHALTNNLPFREYSQSEISDTGLFNGILRSRFKVLESGRPFFCTAITPDVSNRTEQNPHDTREGTVHIVAVNSSGDVSCAVSVAVDTGAKDNGSTIGVPLENRWRPGKYPEGASLDGFREKYIRLNYGIDRDVAPWEMAELYRHFKISEEKNDLACRLGVYTGCYHLLVREARKKDLTPTVYWVFDAIPAYFQLYRYAGAAVLRDFTIANPVQYISPNKTKIKRVIVEGQEQLFYDDMLISRNVKVPFPRKESGSVSFKYKYVPFLDGLVDIRRGEKAVQLSPIFLHLAGIKGFTLGDRVRLRLGAGVIGKRVWDEDYHPRNLLSNLLNRYGLRKAGSSVWSFNEIGSNKRGTDQLNSMRNEYIGG